MSSPLAVCALIFHPQNNEYILGISRKDNHKAFGLIGGKVDEGESCEQAIIREVDEETGFRFFILNKVFERISLGEKDFTTTTFRGTIDFYPPLDWKGQKAGEGIIKWCTKAELASGPFGLYNKNLFSHINL